MNTPPVDRPAWAELIDLAGARLGGRALECSDDFFAGTENLLKPERAVFIPGKFTARGKWMDGWESRRKREPGHDWCIVQLGREGTIRGVNIDTAHFNGNQPEFCSIEGREIPNGANRANTAKTAGAKTLRAAREEMEWVEIVPRTAMRPSSEHFISVDERFRGRVFSHVRLNMHPDGGVARLRVHGHVVSNWPALAMNKAAVELSAAIHGGLVVGANNMHFGSRHNLIMPGRAENMGDGWETRRKRGLTWDNGRPNESDWAVVRLGCRGVIGKVQVDTNHFKGNYPESCEIDACDDAGASSPSTADFDPERFEWTPLLQRTMLNASTIHTFVRQLERGAAKRPCTHVRLRIFPDGGVSRLRVWGRPVL